MISIVGDVYSVLIGTIVGRVIAAYDQEWFVRGPTVWYWAFLLFRVVVVTVSIFMLDEQINPGPWKPDSLNSMVSKMNAWIFVKYTADVVGFTGWARTKAWK